MRAGEKKGDEKAGRVAESIKEETRQRDERQGEQETEGGERSVCNPCSRAVGNLQFVNVIHRHSEEQQLFPLALSLSISLSICSIYLSISASHSVSPASSVMGLRCVHTFTHSGIMLSQATPLGH